MGFLEVHVLHDLVFLADAGPEAGTAVLTSRGHHKNVLLGRKTRVYQAVVVGLVDRVHQLAVAVLEVHHGVLPERQQLHLVVDFQLLQLNHIAFVVAQFFHLAHGPDVEYFDFTVLTRSQQYVALMVPLAIVDGIKV
eukprot:CAMPEP_0116987038 /NCGR_PEP_ID=MMETSP0467-20121206/63259_1 /TAXON_ID=283647 /ORGANISM="Mesodinium pulex, Strain SPMC105" /LENGTH=136 /DNA_ID=CAMNT_0004682763 /DNA_START=123 /DNA_END=533 /DNA_ORIENTATION=+